MALMTKNITERFEDVIEDVARRATGVGYNAMKGWLNAYWANTMASPASLKTASERLSMANVSNSGDQATRANRRALILLLWMKHNANPVMVRNQVIALPGPGLAGQVATLAQKLAIQADQDRGTGALITGKFMEMKTNPGAFLGANRLSCGSIGGGANFRFFYEYSKDQFKIEPPAATPAFAVRAHSFDAVPVPAVTWNAVPGRGANPANGSFAAIAGTDLAGQDVMISTVFSGCSFCFKRETVGAGRMLAAHIMPDDQNGGVVAPYNGQSGTGLARQLGGQVAGVIGGNFTGSAAGNFRVYGCGWSNIPNHAAGYPVRTQLDQFMNVFGTRIAGAWQFWSQHVLNATQTAHRIL